MPDEFWKERLRDAGRGKDPVNRPTDEELKRRGFRLLSEIPRPPEIGEFYWNKNGGSVDYVSAAENRPCSCVRCNDGRRFICVPLAKETP